MTRPRDLKLSRLVSKAVCLLAVPGLCWPAQTPRFEAEVTNIHVQVSVTQNGLVLPGLQAKDFLVEDEGEPQTIIAFGQESIPIRLVLLLDMSGSVRRDLREIASVATAVLKQVRPHDEIGVMSFAVEATIEQPLTSDMQLVAGAIQRVARRGVLHGSGTRLIAPISSALNLLLAHSDAGLSPVAAFKRAILIITDNLPGPGRGDDPDVPFEPVPDAGIIRELLAADTVLNAIVIHRQHLGRRLPPPRDRPEDPGYRQENVIHIAHATGGDALISARMRDSFPQMLARIRNRYSVWYRPPKAETGTFRRITVSLTEEARKRYPNAVVRAREGYYVQ